MSNNLTQKSEWMALEKHSGNIKKQKIISFFKEGENRVNAFYQSLDGLFFDYSKHHLTSETIQKLCTLARACDLESKRDALFNGDKINITEDRAVMHTALRDPQPKNEVLTALNQIKTISDDIRHLKYKGATGKPIEHIISMGTGGSDLGPRLVCDAFKSKKTFPISFVANIDDDDLEDHLMNCDPEKTLFIVISKSFGTQETCANFDRAKKWLQGNLGQKNNVISHFIAITAQTEKAKECGFDDHNIIPLWDGVNGRFSVWSAVGLPIAIALGFDKFQEFLQGAHKMDVHFKTTPLEKNIPVLMALIGIWNINFLKQHGLAILPYAKRLSHFVAYMQQLDMESNGKSVDLNNKPINDYKTSPVLFGEVGTNGQHSFYQLLHQGTDIIPCDFIGFKDKNNALLNNMLAQSQALMTGQNHDNPHQYFEGNRPSSILLFDSLTPQTLGMLLALYEHKIFVQGVIWNINSFDQFGVELGKKMSKNLDKADISHADPSTKNLFDMINKFHK